MNLFPTALHPIYLVFFESLYALLRTGIDIHHHVRHWCVFNEYAADFQRGYQGCRRGYEDLPEAAAGVDEA